MIASCELVDQQPVFDNLLPDELHPRTSQAISARSHAHTYEIFKRVAPAMHWVQVPRVLGNVVEVVMFELQNI